MRQNEIEHTNTHTFLFIYIMPKLPTENISVFFFKQAVEFQNHKKKSLLYNF